MTIMIANINKRHLELKILKIKQVNAICKYDDKLCSSCYLKLLRNIRKILNKYKNEQELIENENILNLLDYQETLDYVECFLNYIKKNYHN